MELTMAFRPVDRHGQLCKRAERYRQLARRIVDRRYDYDGAGLEKALRVISRAFDIVDRCADDMLALFDDTGADDALIADVGAIMREYFTNFNDNDIIAVADTVARMFPRGTDNLPALVFEYYRQR